LSARFSGRSSVIHGQAAQQQPATPEPQLGGDPIRQLKSNTRTREQIRLHPRTNKTERAAINERLRESNRTLEEALNAEKS